MDGAFVFGRRSAGTNVGAPGQQTTAHEALQSASPVAALADKGKPDCSQCHWHDTEQYVTNMTADPGCGDPGNQGSGQQRFARHRGVILRRVRVLMKMHLRSFFGRLPSGCFAFQ
jgi:hypothetical protein